MRARVLARDVSIATRVPQGSSISNILAARTTDNSEQGPGRLNPRPVIGEENMLLSRITRRSCDQLGLSVGMDVFAQAKSAALTTWYIKL